ncbi:MAG: hypothetical protein HIU83_14835 [Proteobacteria bacterium]|nr:hypothetical protein [Pseudomonadota bacterium]
MVLRSRREYLEAIRLRYYRSSKKDKAVTLDEFCSYIRGWLVVNLTIRFDRLSASDILTLAEVK